MHAANVNRSFLMLIAFLAWPPTLLAEHDVKFSTDVNFAIRPSGSGIVARSDAALSLYLYDVTLVTDHPNLVTPKAFRVGIAFEDPTIGRWDVSSWSPYIEIKSVFDATGTLEVKRIDLSIPTSSAPLKGRWLVIEISYVSHSLNGVIATSYAHSSRTIFDGLGN